MAEFQRLGTKRLSGTAGLDTSTAPRRWATTRLSVVKRAGEPSAKQALSVLCQAYWYPVHSFICSLGVGSEDARDVTQAFLEATLLEHNYIASFDPARGRFRSWLRTCARNYVRNWFAHQRSERAGGKAVHVSLDALPADGSSWPKLEDGLTPERLFDKRWASTVVDRALTSLRAQYATEGKPEFFLLPQEESSWNARRVTNRELSVLLGKSEGAVRVQRHRALRDFRKHLRAEVSKTVAASDSVDDEIRQLIGALA